MRGLRVFLRDESGSNVVEYGLLACIITITAIATMSAIGSQLSVFYGSMLAGLIR